MSVKSVSQKQSKQLSVKTNNQNSKVDSSVMTPEKKQFMEQYQNNPRNIKKQSKRKEKLDMYDMIVANLCAGTSIIEPTQKLNNSQLAIGFSNISSDIQLTKYFMISKFPDWMQPRLIDNVRKRCMQNGVKINFYFNCKPHRIIWDSHEMKNRMNVWRDYSREHAAPIDVFDYRTQRGESQARSRMINSTRYLNEAELEHKRSFMKVYFIITISAKRDEESLSNMAESIKSLKELCSQSEIGRAHV